MMVATAKWFLMFRDSWVRGPKSSSSVMANQTAFVRQRMQPLKSFASEAAQL